MKCAKCSRRIECYPCPYCDTRAARKRWSVIRYVFWLGVLVTSIGLVWFVCRGFEAKQRLSRAHKIAYVKEALALEYPDRLAVGVRYEYEFTGAHTLQANRCATRIMDKRMTEAARHLRPDIDQRWEHRALAYELIGAVGGLEDAAYLARVFDENPSERRQCVKRVVQIAARHGDILTGDNETTRFLSKVLRDRRYQEHALKAIALYPHANFALFIEDLIERRRLYCRAEAVLAVLELDAPYSELVMETIFRAATGTQRHEAAVGAARNGNTMAVRWLALVLTDPTTSAGQKYNAEKYLSELEKRLGLSAFETQYEINRPEARLRAVKRAGKLADDSRTGFLGKALSDPVLDVRLAAIRALGERYDPEAVELLVSVLKGSFDPPEDAQGYWRDAALCVAATMLGRMGASDAVPALADLLYAHEPVCDFAHAALVDITGVDYGRDAGSYLEWYERNKTALKEGRDAVAVQEKGWTGFSSRRQVRRGRVCCTPRRTNDTGLRFSTCGLTGVRHSGKVVLLCE